MPDPAGIPAVYECPNCGERLLERRCPDCNLFTRRIGTGGCCPARSDLITLNELLEPPRPEQPRMTR